MLGLLLMLLLYFIVCVLGLLVVSFGSVRLSVGLGNSYSLLCDSSSLLFILTLTSVSLSVLVWAYYYMEGELVLRRFFCLVFSFLCSIYILVFSSDLLRLFVAWDLLGFTSFFLVIFYRSRSALAGGLLTGLTNRIGDVFFLFAFGFSFFYIGPVSFLAVMVLFLVSFTKSAMVPFSSWLPAAILAPTPVSALVHSSTLVTAGVFLLYRFAPLPSHFVLFVGLLTTLVAGIAAFFERDIKKIIALSTLSQLGIMVSSAGCGERSFCFFHLNTHAAFKALLFLAVGSIIHTRYGSQEVRATLVLPCCSPYLLVVLVLSSSSLCGLAFMSGWCTKEAILEAFFSEGGRFASLFIFYLGIALTVIYSFRIIQCLFCGLNLIACSPSFLARSSLIQEPMNWLLCCSLVQGTLLSLNTKLSLSFLSYADKGFVLVISLLSLGLAAFSSNLRLVVVSPLTDLKLRTSLLSHTSGLSSPLQNTEVSMLQGAGLGQITSFLSPISVGAHVLPKLFMLMAAVWLLC